MALWAVAAVFCFFSGLLTGTEGLNVLMVGTVATKSHYIFSSSLTEELLKRGHHVTEFTIMEPSVPHPNRTTYFIEDIFNDPYDYDLVEIHKDSLPFMQYLVMDWTRVYCNRTMRSTGARQLLEVARKKTFKPDVIIMDYIFQQCVSAFIHEFGYPPTIAMTAYANPVEMAEVVYMPVFPAYTPHDIWPQSTDKPLGFIDRLYNLFIHLYSYYLRIYLQFPSMDASNRELFGDDIPTVYDLQDKIDMVLVNSHPVLHGSRPVVPAMLQIAGMHMRPVKPLPKDFKEFLDGAEHGAVLWSFGSIVTSQNMKPEERRTVMAALGRLKQRVIWKFDSEWSPEDGPVPHNVLLRKWIPQTDILAHPAMRLFVSHCGGLSTVEAAFRGVPVLGIPFFMDQFINAEKFTVMGGGKYITYSQITEDFLYHAMDDLLSNPQYLTRMRKLSEVLLDTPIQPMDLAVWAVEHVARHGGSLIKSPAAQISWLARYYIDAALVAVALCLIIVQTVKFLCSRRSQLKGKHHKKKD